MAKAYVTRCVVKKDKKTYKKGAVIEGLTPDEIKKGLAEHWLKKVGADDEPEGSGNSPAAKREKLVKKATDLGVAVSEGMTNEEIQKSIEEAIKKQKRDGLVKKATELGIAVKDEMTNAEIAQAIKEKEKQG